MIDVTTIDIIFPSGKSMVTAPYFRFDSLSSVNVKQQSFNASFRYQKLSTKNISFLFNLPKKTISAIKQRSFLSSYDL